MLKNRQNKKSSTNNADISQYMTTAHVGSWIVLILTFIVVICGAVWMFVGTLKMTMPITGVNDGGKLTFYVSRDEAVQIGTTSGKTSGQVIELNGKKIGIVTGTDLAVSKEQVLAEYDNLYITQQLDLSEANVIGYADLDPDACADGVVSADVVMVETTPLKLLMG